MERKKYIIGGLVIAAIVIVSYLGYNYYQNKEEGHLTEEKQDEHGDHHGSNRKTVELNDSQYKNADIALGWFDLKNMSEVVNANGYTKLPPQNQADVSVFSTGLVKSIKVIEGQEVKKGQLLATVESPEFTILQQNYLVSKSNLTYLELEYDRQLKLSEQDVNAKKVLEKTKANLEIEQAQFNSLKKQLRILRVNGDDGTISSIPIIAPIAGHITDVFVNIGSSVEVGKPLFSIVDNSEMHVDLLVYEKDLFQIEIGQKVHFVLTNQSNKEINGTIFNIGKSFENETKTVAVHAHIEDKEKELIPGMYVNALIDVGENKVKTLPEGAIVQAEGREFIFIYLKSNDHKHQDEHDHKKEDEHSHKEEGAHDHGGINKNKFARVEVKTGASQLGYVQVTPLEKIRQGDKIVTSGAYYLQSHLQKSEGGGGHHH